MVREIRELRQLLLRRPGVVQPFEEGERGVEALRVKIEMPHLVTRPGQRRHDAPVERGHE